MAYLTASGAGRGAATTTSIAHLTDGKGLYIQGESSGSVNLTGIPQFLDVDVVNETNATVHLKGVTPRITAIHRHVSGGSGPFLWADGISYPTSSGQVCTPDDFTALPTSAAADEVIAPGGTVVWHGISVAFSNNPSRNQDACLLATQLDFSFSVPPA